MEVGFLRLHQRNAVGHLGLYGEVSVIQLASGSRQRYSPVHNALEVWRNIRGHGHRDPKVSTLSQITEQHQLSIYPRDVFEWMYLSRHSQRVTNWTFEMQVCQGQGQGQGQGQDQGQGQGQGQGPYPEWLWGSSFRLSNADSGCEF